MNAPIPTPIFHVTHMRNLASILARGCLLSNREMARQGIGYQNIAHGNIQERRGTTPVFVASGAYLHDYVPFHFAPKSPMLYAIYKGKVAGYAEGQEPLIYLVSSAQVVAAAGLSYFFTDGHAIMKFSDQYEDLDDLNRVDWDVMKSKYWFDTEQYPDRCRRREAEFLVYQRFPVSLIVEIGVINSAAQRRIQEALQAHNNKLPVHVRPEWYY